MLKSSLLIVFLCFVFAPLQAQPIPKTTIQFVTSDPAGACTIGSPMQYNTTNGAFWGCQAGTWTSLNGGGTPGTVTSIATTSPITGGTITGTGTIACATCTVTVASGTSALGTSAISANSCATVVTTAATGTLSTDTITWAPNADISGVTGYGVASTDGLKVYPYPTSGNVNWRVCNGTGSSITPGAVTLNWRVVR